LTAAAVTIQAIRSVVWGEIVPVAGVPGSPRIGAAIAETQSRVVQARRVQTRSRPRHKPGEREEDDHLDGDDGQPHRGDVVGADVPEEVVLLEVDAEFAQFDDCRSSPAGRVGREREREGHPVLFAERLAIAQDLVVAGGRFDGEADGLELADELAHVFPHLPPVYQ
jgi:hypothetical protein